MFRHYWWIAIGLAATITWLIVVKVQSNRETLVSGTVAGALGFCYFVQKQRLDELRLFKELFTEFNGRYDRMNEKLADIYTHNSGNNPESRNVLVDYFNLCAEEYLFYQQGYIHPAAWRSWCRGMLYYLKRDSIRRVWDEEVNTDSYYGLSTALVSEGAVLK
jgi:hypothetical protein